MIGKIEFPEGVSWSIDYVTGMDFFGAGYVENKLPYKYRNASNRVIDIKYDIEATSSQSMFYQCTKLIAAPYVNTTGCQIMSSMFYGCESLKSIPNLDFTSATSLSEAFSGCKALNVAPIIIAPNCLNMSNMFYNCTELVSIPQIDAPLVTNITSMFSGCTKITSLPDMNISKVQNFGTYQSGSWLYNTTSLRSIGVLDCDSVTNVQYCIGGSSNNNLTHLGGFRNLGKASSVSNTNSSYFLNYAPNLTYESVINVLNLLYDRASAGLSVLTLKLHANQMAMLSDEDKAIATNKGWILA